MADHGAASDVRRRDESAVRELLETAAQRPRELGALEAQELTRLRPYDTDLPALETVCAAEAAPVRVRRAALVAIARIDTDGARAALREALASSEPLLVRTALEGLGAIGRTTDLEAIERLDLPPAVERIARWSATLIAYRTGAAAYELRLPPESERLPMPQTDASLVAVDRADAEEASQAAREAAVSGPGVALEPENAVELRCLGRRYMFLWTAPPSSGAGAFLEGKRIAGVVARLYPEKTDPETWETQYVVLTHPLGKREVAIAIATRGGHLMLYGTAVVKEAGSSFELHAADIPGGTPLEARGRYEGGRLSFDSISSGVRHVGKLVPEAEP